MGLFAGIPREYDFFLALFTFLMDHVWRRAVASEADETWPILDVATGTGLMLSKFARLDAKVFVVGVDISIPMLRQAKAILQRSRYKDRVNLVLARAEHLPIRNASVGTSTITLALRNLSNPQDAFREMCRVLMRRGKVVCLDFTRPPDRLFRSVYYFYIFRVLPLLGGLVSRAWRDIFEYLSESIDRARPPDEVARMMELAGLTAIRYTYMSRGIVGLVCSVKLL